MRPLAFDPATHIRFQRRILIDLASDLDLHISDVVWRNERTWRTAEEIDAGIDRLWATMRDCMWRGCYREGILPGGLNVVRRAARINAAILGDETDGGRDSWEEWVARIRRTDRGFVLTAGEIGSLFKKGATISAAMGGYQAEIGVSSAMADWRSSCP